MKQPSMGSIGSVITLGGLVAGGLSTLGETLNLHYVDHTTFAAELADLIAKQDLHLQAKQTRKVRRAALNKAMSDCRVFARVTRDLLKPVLGYSYSENWEALGFNANMRVPSRISTVTPMMHAIRGYLTANPTVENAAANVTAARATTLYNALNAAHHAIAMHDTTMKTLIASRDTQQKLVRDRISQLTKELTNVLTPLDARWATFGLNEPGKLVTPPTPGKLVLVLANSNALSVKWEPVPRAEYYRVWVKVKNRDQEFVPVGNTDNTQFTIEDLPAETEVEVAVSAVNNGGESARSEVYKVTTL